MKMSLVPDNVELTWYRDTMVTGNIRHHLHLPSQGNSWSSGYMSRTERDTDRSLSETEIKQNQINDVFAILKAVYIHGIFN